MSPPSWSTSGDSLQRALALAVVPAPAWEGTAIQTGSAHTLTAGLGPALITGASLLGPRRVANAAREIRPVGLVVAGPETARRQLALQATRTPRIVKTAMVPYRA